LFIDFSEWFFARFEIIGFALFPFILFLNTKTNKKCIQDGLIETLRRTKPRFVYCFIPNHRAGLVDLSSSTFAANDDSLQVPLLRSQVNNKKPPKNSNEIKTKVKRVK
jgi:hypothetical protein